MQNILHLMDIQTWQARRPLPGAKQTTQYFGYELIDIDDEQIPLGRFLVAAGLDLSDETCRLIDAMIFAINCTKIELGMGEFKKFSNSDLPLLIFGSKQGNRPATHSTKQILSNPIVKREIWVELQKFLKTS